MKFWYNPNFLAVLTLLFLSIPALKSLAIPGFYTSHDGETHTARIAQYYQALSDGQLPPRFANTFYNGFGSPIFVYIYPLPYILGSFFHQLGFSFTDSFEILMAIGFIFSGLFYYLWLREVFASEKAAFIGALFYVWAPYRFLLVYVRGSISELLAYTFLPLVFFSLTKLERGKIGKWLPLVATTLAFLLLSQNLVAMISLPLIVFYILIKALYSKSLFYFSKGALAILWGFLIASFVYLPSLFERKFVRFDETIGLSYANHFVSLKQLFRSPWGYGFDLPGTVNDQISLQIGLPHIFIFILTIILLFYHVLSRFFRMRRIKMKFLTNASSLPLILSVFFLIIVVVLIFLMIQSEPTIFLWQHLKVTSFIDIPWRLLGLVALSSSFLAAFVVYAIRNGLFFIFLMAFVLVANRNHLRINLTQFFSDDFFLNYSGTATQYNEFTPKWRQTTRVPIGFSKDVNVESLSGEVNIFNVFAKSNEVSFNAEVFSSISQVRINKFYFPRASVIADGTKLVPFKDFTITGTSNLRLEKEQDSSGLMLINLGKGDHSVRVMLGETPLRLFANYLSLGAFLLAGGIILKNVKK